MFIGIFIPFGLLYKNTYNTYNITSSKYSFELQLSGCIADFEHLIT